MKYKLIIAISILTALFMSSCAKALPIQTSTSPLTIFGVDFENVRSLPICTENDANTDLNNYEGKHKLVLQPFPVACITPHLTCKVGEWTPATFTPMINRSARVQGRVQTLNGVRAIYAMHMESSNVDQTERFEIGVNDLVDADIRAYLNKKYGQPNLMQANQKTMEVIEEISRKLTPDSLLFWQVNHKTRSYIIYYARVGKRQIIAGVELK